MSSAPGVSGHNRDTHAGTETAAALPMPPEISPSLRCCLLANLNALALDYVAKRRVANINLNFFFVEQFPMFPPRFLPGEVLLVRSHVSGEVDQSTRPQAHSHRQRHDSVGKSRGLHPAGSQVEPRRIGRRGQITASTAARTTPTASAPTTPPASIMVTNPPKNSLILV